MSKSQEAVSTFESGFNCAQSVLYTYGNEYFKENELALKLASGFGAGIAYRAEMCGAVSGALMVIGLKYGYSSLQMDMRKELTYRLTKEFITLFEKENNSIICKQLLQTDISSSDGLEMARQKGLFKSKCPLFIASGSNILEELFVKYPENKLVDV